jgi:hypothetical protein
MAFPAHSGPWPLIQFCNHFSQTVGLLGRVISPSQGLCLNIGQHKQNKRICTPNIHALSGIRTHDPSVRASEDSSCLRPRGCYDRQWKLRREIYSKILPHNINCSIWSKAVDVRSSQSFLFIAEKIIFLGRWKTYKASCNQGFEILTAVVTKSSLFWDKMSVVRWKSTDASE